MNKNYIESLIGKLNQLINDETKLINDIKESIELEKTNLRYDYVESIIPDLSEKVLELLISDYKFKFQKVKKFSFKHFSFQAKIKNTKSIKVLREELYNQLLDDNSWPESIYNNLDKSLIDSLETNINVLDSVKIKLELLKKILNIDFDKLKFEILNQLTIALCSFEKSMDSYIVNKKELYVLYSFPEKINKTNLESWLWSSIMLKNSDLNRDILRISNESAISN